MNYFGHAVIAHRVRPSPTFVLGAMLPDLVQLTDEPLAGLLDAELLAGIDLHHRTDALFHGSPTFIGLCHEALARARGVGVRKGPARAMTHLVVELLIDAKLAQEGEAQTAYMSALASRPADLTGRVRMVEGLDWLLSRGPGVHNATPSRLAAVLGSALRGRPRLQPEAAELSSALGAWTDLEARVNEALPDLLSDLAPLFVSSAEQTQASPSESFREPAHRLAVTLAP